jgi:glycine/D-amino acid oxidase-like deaminating enzyme
MTAYFMLQETDKNVVLVDANKIAHGATGHNAGQIDAFFEKPVQELIKTY